MGKICSGQSSQRKATDDDETLVLESEGASLVLCEGPSFDTFDFGGSTDTLFIIVWDSTFDEETLEPDSEGSFFGNIQPPPPGVESASEGSSLGRIQPPAPRVDSAR